MGDPKEVNRSGLHGNSAFNLRLLLQHHFVRYRYCDKGDGDRILRKLLRNSIQSVSSEAHEVVADGQPFLSPFLAQMGLAIDLRECASAELGAKPMEVEEELDKIELERAPVEELLGLK